MAGSQISTSVSIISSLLGFQAISLTELNTSALSSIAAGSKVEIAGAFFTFDSDTSVSGFSSITTGQTCYLALTPSGTAGSQILTASWTQSQPVWDTAKQGWYTTTSSSIRVVGGCLKQGPSSKINAFVLEMRQTPAPVSPDA